jgi:hypothetical protein
MLVVACAGGSDSGPAETTTKAMPSPATAGEAMRALRVSEMSGGELSIALGIDAWRTTVNGESATVEGMSSDGATIVTFEIAPGQPGTKLVQMTGGAATGRSPSEQDPYFAALYTDSLGVPGSSTQTPEVKKDGVFACCYGSTYVGYITVYGGGYCHIDFQYSPCSGYWDCTYLAGLLGCTTWI